MLGEPRVRGRCPPGGQVGMKAAVLQTPRRCAPRPTKQDNSRRFTGDSLRCTRGSETSIDATSRERETRVFFVVCVCACVCVCVCADLFSWKIQVYVVEIHNNIIRDKYLYVHNYEINHFLESFLIWNCERNCRWCYKDVKKIRVISHCLENHYRKTRYFLDNFYSSLCSKSKNVRIIWKKNYFTVIE